MSDILDRETAKLDTAFGCYLRYTYRPNDRDSCVLTYSFRNDLLFEATATYFPGEGSDLSPLFEDFSEKWTARLESPAKTNDRQKRWELGHTRYVSIQSLEHPGEPACLRLTMGQDWALGLHFQRSDRLGFRGPLLGMSLEEVKAIEPNPPIDEDGSYLLYDYAINPEDSYTITYSFGRNGLYEIEVDAYFQKDLEKAEMFASDLFGHLTEYGGPSSWNMEKLQFETETEQSKEVEIILQDESANFSMGKVSLSIYNWDD